MSGFEVHRAGDRFVISTDVSSFNVLLSLARQMHRPPLQDASPGWLTILAETLRQIGSQLPSRRSCTNTDEAYTAKDIPGVDFVGYTAQVVFGVHADVLQRIEDCLAAVVTEGDDPDLHTLTGAWFPEIRRMYLTVAGAGGHFRSAHQAAFPDGWVARGGPAEDID